MVQLKRCCDVENWWLELWKESMSVILEEGHLLAAVWAKLQHLFWNISLELCCLEVLTSFRKLGAKVQNRALGCHNTTDRKEGERTCSHVRVNLVSPLGNTWNISVLGQWGEKWRKGNGKWETETVGRKLSAVSWSLKARMSVDPAPVPFCILCVTVDPTVFLYSLVGIFPSSSSSSLCAFLRDRQVLGGNLTLLDDSSQVRHDIWLVCILVWGAVSEALPVHFSWDQVQFCWLCVRGHVAKITAAELETHIGREVRVAFIKNLRSTLCFSSPCFSCIQLIY